MINPRPGGFRQDSEAVLETSPAQSIPRCRLARRATAASPYADLAATRMTVGDIDRTSADHPHPVPLPKPAAVTRLIWAE